MSTNSVDRLKSMATNSPFRDYNVYASFKVDDMALAEYEVHSYLKECGIDYKSEWFEVNSDECIILIDKALRNLVSESLLTYCTRYI